jgi:exopolysaccharide production protein ExoZ
MWLMAVWGSAILSMIILSPVTPYPLPTHQFPISFLLSPYNLFYVLGLGVAVLQLRYKVRLSSMIFAIGLAIIILMTFKTNTSSLGALTIIALAGALMLAGSNDVVAKGPLQFLVIMGDASYTFYLIQNPILGLLMRLVKRLPAPMHPLGATEIGVGCFIIILIVALIFYKFIEKPLLDLLRRLLQPATVIDPPIRRAEAARA